MTHVLSMRLEVACDDTVLLRDVRDALVKTLSECGTEHLTPAGQTEPARIHWGTVAIKQGPETLSAKALKARKLRQIQPSPRLPFGGESNEEI